MKTAKASPKKLLLSRETMRLLTPSALREAASGLVKRSVACTGTTFCTTSVNDVCQQ